MALPEGSDPATSATSAGSATTRLRALLLGDPGAGKSTQAHELAASYGVPHVSMGELLREQGTEKTAAGQRVAREVAAGELVPDSLVIEVLLRYLTRSNAKDSYVLDGFPRTLAQAESWQEQALQLGCAPSIAIWLVVPRTELLTRLRDRRVRIGRPDDADEGISRRLTISLQSRELLQGFYRQLGASAACRGVRVAVVEQASFPRDTLSTHFIHAQALAFLDRLGVMEKIRAQPALRSSVASTRARRIWSTSPRLPSSRVTSAAWRRCAARCSIRSWRRPPRTRAPICGWGTKVIGLVEDQGRVSGVQIAQNGSGHAPGAAGHRRRRSQLHDREPCRGSQVQPHAERAVRVLVVLRGGRAGLRPGAHLPSMGRPARGRDACRQWAVSGHCAARSTCFLGSGRTWRAASWSTHAAAGRWPRYCRARGASESSSGCCAGRDSSERRPVLAGCWSATRAISRSRHRARGFQDAFRQVDALAPAIAGALDDSAGDILSALQAWGRWRDKDAAGHYWLATDMGKAGPMPTVLPEMQRRLLGQGKIDMVTAHQPGAALASHHATAPGGRHRPAARAAGGVNGGNYCARSARSSPRMSAASVSTADPCTPPQTRRSTRDQPRSTRRVSKGGDSSVFASAMPSSTSLVWNRLMKPSAGVTPAGAGLAQVLLLRARAQSPRDWRRGAGQRRSRRSCCSVGRSRGPRARSRAVPRHMLAARGAPLPGRLE